MVKRKLNRVENEPICSINVTWIRQIDKWTVDQTHKTQIDHKPMRAFQPKKIWHTILFAKYSGFVWFARLGLVQTISFAVNLEDILGDLINQTETEKWPDSKGSWNVVRKFSSAGKCTEFEDVNTLERVARRKSFPIIVGDIC